MDPIIGQNLCICITWLYTININIVSVSLESWNILGRRLYCSFPVWLNLKYLKNLKISSPSVTSGFWDLSFPRKHNFTHLYRIRLNYLQPTKWLKNEPKNPFSSRLRGYKCEFGSFWVYSYRKKTHLQTSKH